MKIVDFVMVLVVLMGIGYYGQAKKAYKVQQLRLQWQYEENKISKNEYHKLLDDLTLSSVLMNPKLVFESD